MFINKLKLLKVFAICETVDHSSDIQQTPPLTKMKNFWQISLQGVYKLLRSNEKAPQLSEEKIGGQIFRLSLPQTQDDVRKVTVSQKRINYVLLSLQLLQNMTSKL